MEALQMDMNHYLTVVEFGGHDDITAGMTGTNCPKNDDWRHQFDA
jgi:hypothetical protein